MKKANENSGLWSFQGSAPAGFIKDENLDEAMVVTPIGWKEGDPIPDDFDPFAGGDIEDDDDPSFYTQEDYENMPILRYILRSIGGDDPLGRDFADLDEAGEDDEEDDDEEED